MGGALAGLAGTGVAGPAAAQPDALLDAEELAWVAKHPVLLFAPERDFPPFSFVDSQGQHRGLSADVLDLVQQHTGLKFQPVAAGDRSSNLDRLRRHEIDLLTSLRPTPERERFVAFTSAYVSSPAVILRRRGDHRSGDLAKMGGQRVAVDRNSAAEYFLHTTYPDVVIAEVDVAAQGLRDVVTGDVDACAVNLRRRPTSSSAIGSAACASPARPATTPRSRWATARTGPCWAACSRKASRRSATPNAPR
jgi:ABC-type amino acid transport substrate-binding protein